MGCVIFVRVGVKCMMCMGAAVNGIVCVRTAGRDEGATEKNERLPQEEQGNCVHQHDDDCLASPSLDCYPLSTLVVLNRSFYGSGMELMRFR